MTARFGRLRPLMGDLLVVDGLRILAVNVAGAGLAFLSHILFARWLTVASYGAYVVALSWLSILFILVQAGLNVALIRLVAEARGTGGGRATMTALLRFSNTVVLSLGVGACIAGAVMIALLAPPPEQARALYGMLGLTIVLALMQQRAAVLQGLERVVPATAVAEILRPLLLLAAVWAAGQAVRLDAGLVMALNLAATAVVLLLTMRLARRAIAAEPLAGLPPAAGAWRGWLKISLPYVAVAGLTILLMQMDVLMIGAILGAEQAAIYAPAAKVALLAVFPVVAIRQRFGPQAARLFAEGGTPELQSRMTLATTLSVAACLGAVIVIVGGREFILSLFGPAYTAGGVVVAILSAGYLAYSVAGAAEMFFLVGPFERLNALIVALTLALNLALNLALIPPLGIVGAAWATVGAVVFRALASAAIIHRRTGILPLARAKGVRT